MQLKNKISEVFKKNINEKIDRTNLINLSNNYLAHPKMKYLLEEFFSKFDKESVLKYPYYQSTQEYYKNYTNISELLLCFCPGTDLAIFYLILLAKELRVENIIIQHHHYYAYEDYAHSLGLNYKNISYYDICEENLNNTLSKIEPTFIFLVSPSCLIGQEIPYENLIKFLDVANRNGHFVILDQAYAGFGTNIHLNLLEKFDNLCILHTFSKAFGCAGLRLGCIMSKSDLIYKLIELGLEQAVSTISLSYVKYIVENKHQFDEIQNDIVIWREQTQLKLVNMIKNKIINKMSIFKSKSNFISIDMLDENIVEKIIFNCLSKYNIYIKPIKKFRSLLRFTVTSPHIMENIINEIKNEAKYV